MNDPNLRRAQALDMQQARPPADAGAPPAQTYPLHIRDARIRTAWSLALQTLPYALARFGVLLVVAALCLAWCAIGPGGAWWIDNHVSTAFAVAWLVPWLVAAGAVWRMILRYALHLIACGHVAVVTQLMMKGALDKPGESQFRFGRRLVEARFGEVNALFGLNLTISGVLVAFNRTLEWVGSLLPIPGIGAVESLINAIMNAAARYVDKVVLSYVLANPDRDRWRCARDGIIYYCQNAAPILKTSVWIVLAEGALTVVLFLALLVPAAAITAWLPQDVRELDGAVILALALLFAAAIRASFLKPLFLIVLILRFHLLIRNQAVSPQWIARLDSLSDQFSSLASYGPAPAR